MKITKSMLLVPYIRQARIAKDLKDLRDQSVFAFFMMNALFVLIVFLLQLNKDLLHVKWPFGIKTNISFNADNLHEVNTAPSTSSCPASSMSIPLKKKKEELISFLAAKHLKCWKVSFVHLNTKIPD